MCWYFRPRIAMIKSSIGQPTTVPDQSKPVWTTPWPGWGVHLRLRGSQVHLPYSNLSTGPRTSKTGRLKALESRGTRCSYCYLSFYTATGFWRGFRLSPAQLVLVLFVPILGPSSLRTSVFGELPFAEEYVLFFLVCITTGQVFFN